MTSDAPKSICLLRLSALGDVCNMVPAVRAIQQTWPAAKLTWIIGRMEHRLLKALPRIEFIVFDKKAGWRGFIDLRRKLDGQRFDILLQAQVSARANLLSLLIRAERRVGFDPDRAREGHGLVVNEHIAACPGQHQALALQAFADHIGATTEGVARSLPVSEAARAFAAMHQPEPGHAVLISPASSHAGRNWSPAGYAQVADWIVERTARPVILIGGPSEAERSLGAEISRRMKHQAINLIGHDTLDQALAMLDRAACLITPDAGPAHFAAAMGTPVIGLYAATWSRRSGPLGSLEHCVDKYAEAARKYTGKAPDALRWGRRLEFPGVMDLITPDEVIEKLQPIIADLRI